MSAFAVINARELVTCAQSSDVDEAKSLGLIEDGALVVEGGRVSWLGTTRLFRQGKGGDPKKVIDANNGIITPGFVDPHTHLAFAGSREDELERKVAGESYKDILESGGGIIRTLKDTRLASVGAIVQQSSDRVQQLVRNGVTTVEVKTGYGQDLRSELKLLEAIRRLGRGSGVEVVQTFLGLHATPPEFATSEDFVREVTRNVLPVVGGLKERPRFSDCFCEEGVFSRGQCERYLKASKTLGFETKIHADEFVDSGGASLAAEAGCISADHLGFSDKSGIEAMAEAEVAAVLLPMTSFYSGIRYARAREIVESGCPVALGTDLSPNSWVESPQMVMSVACAGLKLSPAEALLGFTSRAAKALGRTDIGTLTVGNRANFVIHDVGSYRFLPYRVGGRYVRSVYSDGTRVYESGEV